MAPAANQEIKKYLKLATIRLAKAKRGLEQRSIWFDLIPLKG
jgi:hypothetical protein